MRDEHPTTCTRLGGDMLLRAVAGLSPDDVTVTGYAGSGYSRLTDVFGAAVYRGKLPLDWTTPVLVAMREALTADAVDMLRGLGIEDPRAEFRRLRPGDALLFRRG